MTAAEEHEAESEAEAEAERDDLLIYDGAGSDDDWGMVEAPAAATPRSTATPSNPSGRASRDRQAAEAGSGLGAREEAKGGAGLDGAEITAASMDAGVGSDAGAAADGVGADGASGADGAEQGGWMGLEQDPHASQTGLPPDIRDVHAPRRFGSEADAVRGGSCDHRCPIAARTAPPEVYRRPAPPPSAVLRQTFATMMIHDPPERAFSCLDPVTLSRSNPHPFYIFTVATVGTSTTRSYRYSARHKA